MSTADLIARRAKIAALPQHWMNAPTIPNGAYICREAVMRIVSEDIERPEIICLCGSSRFIELFAVLGWEFEKEGKIVVGLHLLPASYTKVKDHLAEHEGVAAQMDELHLRKIDLSDRVFVVNKDGYVGDSTRREIAYARSVGKPIVYLEEPR